MRILMGISEACCLPASVALIADYHRGSTRSLATGVYVTGIYLGCSFAGLGGWLAERRGWSCAFSVVGLAGVAYGVLLPFALRDTTREEGRPMAGEAARSPATFRAALTSLFSCGSFILALAYCGILGAVGWMIAGWMPVYFAEHFHLGAGAAGLSANGYLNMAALFGLLVGGVWADRWAATNERGRILVPVIGLVVAGPGILMAAQTNLFGLAALGLTLYGFAAAFSDSNAMPILCLISDPRYRATGYGLLNMAGTVSGGLAVYAAGVFRDERVDLGKVMAIASGGLGICVVLLLLIKRRPVRAHAN
jgi:MFS family permease